MPRPRRRDKVLHMIIGLLIAFHWSVVITAYYYVVIKHVTP